MTVIEQRAYEAIIKMAQKDEPDYWTRLEHQYAGMAMQGILSNPEYLSSLMYTKHNDYGAHEIVPDVAVRLSHALVKELKEKEESPIEI